MQKMNFWCAFFGPYSIVGACSCLFVYDYYFLGFFSHDSFCMFGFVAVCIICLFFCHYINSFIAIFIVVLLIVLYLVLILCNLVWFLFICLFAILSGRNMLYPFELELCFHSCVWIVLFLLLEKAIWVKRQIHWK